MHGHDLRSMDDDYIASTQFVCPYDQCAIMAVPSSYRATNKHSSYFKYLDQHTANCGVQSAASAQLGGGSDIDSATSTERALPTLYISSLRIEGAVRKSKEDGDVVPAQPQSESSGGTSRSSVEQSKGSTTSSIRPIVDYYLQNPDKFYKTLYIPSAGTKTYRDHFQMIYYHDDNRFRGEYIYYGKLNSFTKIDMSKKFIELEFLARKKGGKPLRLRVDISKWKADQKAVFENEYLDESSLGKKYFIGTKEHPDKRNKYLWVFFFGQPDIKDRFLFHVDNFKLIYFRFMKDFELPKNNLACHSISRSNDNTISLKHESKVESSVVQGMRGTVEDDVVANEVIDVASPQAESEVLQEPQLENEQPDEIPTPAVQKKRSWIRRLFW